MYFSYLQRRDLNMEKKREKEDKIDYVWNCNLNKIS